MASKGTLTVRVVGDAKPFEKTMSGLGSTAKVGMAAVGSAVVIGGAVAAKGFFEAVDQEASTDRFASSLGLEPAEAEMLGEVAGDLYAGAWGDSFEQVQGAVANVRSELGELGQQDLEDVTTNALDFAKAFNQDVQQSIGAAGILMRNGLVKDGEEAFDLLTLTMQQVPQSAREEVLAATEEYSTFFADLGISGEEAFGAIAQAAEKGGRFGVDKVGDAIKEFGIRASDMSESSKKAFETIGLDAEDMAQRILAGGDTARGAFDEIVSTLRWKVPDATDQAKAAVALFGTPLEDLSTGEIPEFLGQLENMGDAFEGTDGVAGAADRMGEQLNDNVKTKIEAFKRQGMQKLVDFMGNVAIPAVEKFAPVVEDVFGEAQRIIGDAVAKIGEWIDDNRETFETLAATVQTVIDNVVGWFRGGEQQFGESSGKISEILSQLGETFSSYFEAYTLYVQKAVEVITDLWNRFGSDLINFTRETFDNILDLISGVLEAVRGVFEVFAGIFTGDWARVWDGIKMILAGVWDSIRALVEQALNIIDTVIQVALGGISAIWSATWNGMKTFVSDIWVGIKKLVGNAIDGIVWTIIALPERIRRAAVGAFDGIRDAFRSALNWIIDAWNSLEFSLPGFDPPGPGPKFGGVTIGTPNIPRLASGGLLTSPTLFVGGEYPGARSNPEIVSPERLMRRIIREESAGAQVINLVVDGKVLARVVNDHNVDARRRGSRVG